MKGQREMYKMIKYLDDMIRKRNKIYKGIHCKSCQGVL